LVRALKLGTDEKGEVKVECLEDPRGGARERAKGRSSGRKQKRARRINERERLLIFPGSLTLVTAVPPTKKTTRHAKKTDHGCMACTHAVAAATAMPAGVSDLRYQARATSKAVTGAAIAAFMTGCSAGG
jgi:hypothetical protein